MPEIPLFSGVVADADFFLYINCMKNKVVIIFFGALFAVLAVVLALRFTVFRKIPNVHAKVVTPVSSDKIENGTESSALSGENVTMTSFIPLLSTETLISALTLDFDGDNLDDQVVAVYKAGSENLYLIVGLYNSVSNSYERVAEISTEISRERTFSFNALDMVGNHRNVLVYQGVDSSGDSVMKIYMCSREKNSVALNKIGDFKSDGTIFILQTERSEAYELSQTRGQSFSVWVYSTDKTDEQKTSSVAIGQIQTEYVWNEEEQKYTQGRQIRVTGSRLAARELARIQNGNVATFAEYLDGLWYKTSSTDESASYIYFNYGTKEVIFLSNDTEGVYSWENSSLRRSGIYLTLVNSIISSMKRRLDIMLTGVNEVYIRVHEDVGLLIKENNHWDGTYKKMSFQSTFGEEKINYPHPEYEKKLSEVQNWQDEENRRISFKNGTYTLTNSEGEEKGVYLVDTVGDFPVIQFRPENAQESSLLPAYAMQFKTTEELVPAKRRNQKPTVKTTVDKNTIIMLPVKLSPDTCYATDGMKITLSKAK